MSGYMSIKHGDGGVFVLVPGLEATVMERALQEDHHRTGLGVVVGLLVLVHLRVQANCCDFTRSRE